MKSLTVRLPETLIADIEAECRRRRLAKSDVVRERLTRRAGAGDRKAALLQTVADLRGCLDFLPADLSLRKQDYLKSRGYGQKRPR